MKFTKVKSLPSPFARAFARDDYSKGESRFSVTQLLSPSQQTYLATQGEGIKSQAMGYASLMGTAVHKVLEDNVREDLGELAEVRFFTEIDGILVSGQMDYYEDGIVSDYKNIAGEKDEPNPDHVLQAHMNGYLAEKNGVEVRMCSIVYVQRDWRESQATLNPSYPQSPFNVFVFDYDRELAKSKFSERIKEHLQAEEGNPRDCTREEQWRKPETWAIKKQGGLRASKLCDSLKEAESLKKPDQIIEYRPGMATRCLSYCCYSHLCLQKKRESAL